jgi:hypothetical protein
MGKGPASDLKFQNLPPNANQQMCIQRKKYTVFQPKKYTVSNTKNT